MGKNTSLINLLYAVNITTSNKIFNNRINLINLPNINTTPDRIFPTWNIKNTTNYKYIWIFTFLVAAKRGIGIWSTLGHKEIGRELVTCQISLYHVNCNFALIIELKYCCLKFLHHFYSTQMKTRKIDSAWLYSILYIGSKNRKLQESKALLYFSWALWDININLQILVVDALLGGKNCCIQSIMNRNTTHNPNRAVPVRDL